MSDPINILCYGDSNTHGSTPYSRTKRMNRFPVEDRWPSQLAATLGDGYHVIPEGLGGRTTVFPDPVEGEHKSGLLTLVATLESHKPLDVVILKLGTNDLKHRFALVPSDIAKGCGRLIRSIKATDCSLRSGGPRILLICPPPIHEVAHMAEMFSGGRQKSLGLTAAYQAIAEEHGVDFLDAGQVIEVAPEDGIHYSAEAQRALGDAVAVKIGDMLS